MAAWADELTIISQQPPDERVNAGGFENEPQESARTVFCNKKKVGYSEIGRASCRERVWTYV